MPETSRMTNNSVRALKNALAYNSRDWALNKTEAWLWGIVLGWDGDDTDPGGAMAELAARHGWDAFDVANLRRLHEHFESLSEAEPAPRNRGQDGPIT